MKKRIIACVLSVLLTLTSVAFAYPQTTDTVKKSYDGSTAMILTTNKQEFTVTQEPSYYSITDTYYHITGTCTSALTASTGECFINMDSTYTKSESAVYILEFDFMLGNADTKFAIRERGYSSTDGATYSTNATPKNPVSSIAVGSVLGDTTIAQSQWYRLAVVFDMKKDTTTTYKVYLNGADVSDGIGETINSYGFQWARIQPVIANGKDVEMSVDNLRLYQTEGSYTAGETAAVTSKDSSVAVIRGNNISVPAGVTETQLKDALEVSTGATLTAIGTLDPILGGTVAVRSQDGIYTYYKVTVTGAPTEIFSNSGADTLTLSATNTYTSCVNTAAPQYTDDSKAIHITDTVVVGDGRDYFTKTLGDKNYMIVFDALLENDNTAFGFRMRRANTSGTNLGFDLFGVSAYEKTGTGVVTVSPKQWNRYAATFNKNSDGTYSYVIYLNNEQKGSGSLTAEKFSEFRAQIYAAKNGASGVYLKNIAVYAYDEKATYRLPAAAQITAMDASLGTLNSSDNTIVLNENVSAERLIGSLTLTSGAQAIVLKGNGTEISSTASAGCILAVMSVEGIFKYYSLNDNSYVNFDFDSNAPATYGNCAAFETATDAERGGKVLHMSWDSSKTGSAYFRVDNLEFTGSYIVSYALKRSGDNCTVTTTWGTNTGDNSNAVNGIYAGSSQTYATEVNSGNRPGEWVQYATFVDTDKMQSTMYINGIKVGEPVALDSETMRYLPGGTGNNYLRFFLLSGSTDDIYLDDFKIYPAQNADGLNKWNCSLSAKDASGLSVTSAPAAMGKIEGATGKRVSELLSLLNSAEGTSLNVISDGTIVDGDTIIADGMVLKATLNGTSSLYRFAAGSGDWVRSNYENNTLKLYADSFGSVIIIGHYKDVSGGTELVKTTVIEQGTGYVYMAEDLADGADYMKAFLWDSISGISPSAQSLCTMTLN